MILLKFLKLSVRYFVKHKIYSFFTLSSLVLSLACGTLTYLLSKNENNFDRHNISGDRIYRMAMTFIDEEGERVQDAFSPLALAPAMVSEIPEVEGATRIENVTGKLLVTANEKAMYERGYGNVDPEFFKIFSVTFIEGKAASAFPDKASLVLTRSAKEKYFGQQPAINQMMTVGTETKIVTGVIEDFPSQSHFHFSMIGKLQSDEMAEYGWSGYNWYTYFKIRPGAKVSEVVEKTQTLLNSNIAESTPECFAQPLFDIHLHSNIKSEIETNGNSSLLLVISIAGCILLLAGIFNFVNLSLVRALWRTREAGISKLFGASIFRLFLLFFLESIVYVISSFYLATLLVWAVLPYINSNFHQSLTFHILSQADLFWLAIFLTALSLVASALPALHFAGAQPIHVLKGSTPDGGRIMVRKVLVGIQLAVTISVVTCILIINRQMNFLETRSMGFNKEQVIVISGFSRDIDHEAAKSRFLQLPGIQSAAFAQSLPGDEEMFFLASTRNSRQRVMMNYTFIDNDYIKTLGLKIEEGRGFSSKFPEDVRNFSLIVNQTAARILGLNGNAVGAEITSDPDNPNALYFKVVGVVNDFHYRSLHEEIKPFLFAASNGAPNLVLRLNTPKYTQAIEAIKNVWTELEPDRPFDYHFLDEALAQSYQQDKTLQRLLVLLGCVLLFIACSGLFALSLLLINARKKEIGIRKTLGATVWSIYLKVNSEYAIGFVLALVASIPLTLVLALEWLSTFAYRIEIGPLDFVLATSFAAATMLITLSYQSISLARLDPVETLKTE